jgi:hypothetical protein
MHALMILIVLAFVVGVGGRDRLGALRDEPAES